MGSTARTPVSLAILTSCAAVIPAGTAAMRSGTNSCRGGAPAEPGTWREFGTEPLGAATPGGGLAVKVRVPPEGPGLAAAPSGTANAVSVTHAAATVTTAS